MCAQPAPAAQASLQMAQTLGVTRGCQPSPLTSAHPLVPAWAWPLLCLRWTLLLAQVITRVLCLITQSSHSGICRC